MVVDKESLRLCVYSTFYGLPSFTKDSIKNHLYYCNKHGYAYKPYLFDKPTTRQFSWAKILLGIELLRSSQWDAIFWMDADSWFLNCEYSLDQWLLKTEDIQFTGDINDVFNGGHFLLKNSAQSIEWLKSCWEVCETSDHRIVTTHKNDKQLFDQPGILAVLGGANPLDQNTWADGFNRINGYPGNPYRTHKDFQQHYAPTKESNCEAARSLICDRWRPHCFVHPQKSMNSYPDDVDANDFIVHFVGNTKHLMQEWRENFKFYAS